ncbi:D-Ala-D-Ala carboxypeptidase family metallohydrolase [Fibrobacter intestinalis]|uniref:Peptidase M15 n=1 Tax=Fibrobacter intestinalis TaxID=28122 RepID=A0A1T4S108_9BACT|nr:MULTISPECIES: D-Ala-D-Ala carboxypeptidase family metallohydrolase [Fibrobacter]PBC72449.1 peptidase M15-like protein [Fibrobacter sp. NR9]PBC73036.1 peptidase M15-like protein [Fibrobacter sp. NR9]SKA17645.1 Peptidase M15 [Fibrobacter intestinalis]SKA21934.1 Peptidase M15 [Fibrobacter intestinalis]
MKSEKIFPNFTLKEMLSTSTGLPNFPETWEQFVNLHSLAGFLQCVRNIYGKPIIVNSAFRSEAVNEKAGGVKSSYHLKGLAADIRGTDAKGNAELLGILKRNISQIDQLIAYRSVTSKRIRFIHVGLPEAEKKPRMQVMEK